MKITLLFILVFSSLFANTQQEDMTKQAIVKIYTTSKIPDYQVPWASTVQRSTGSGSIIDGGFILTNAHVVADQAFIEVQRYGQRKRYIAKVYAVSHQADLALLKVEEEAFFSGVTALKFGELPAVEQKIVVYGYPMGGSTLSATIGVVSRVEHHTYAHSGEMFLAIQVDAAVNPGNSGGPALSDGKIVGVVMQVISKSQNIGYIVPAGMVKHFIDDMKDAHYDGFVDLGMGTQKLENPALRDYYGLDENITGIVINEIMENSALKNLLFKGDIITHINEYNVENDGTVAFREHEYTNLHYVIDAHQVGESVSFSIIRKQKKMNVEVKLKNTADDMALVKTTRYDAMPSYFVYGGYIFSPLTRNLIVSTNNNRLQLSNMMLKRPKKEKREVVVLLKVMASDLTRGNNNFSMWPIEKMNGESFVNFKDFHEKIQKATGKFIVLEDEDGVQLIIDRKEALEKQSDILKKYNVEFDKSIDLRS